MIRAKFLSPRQRDALEQIVRRPSEDHGVARRANAVLLLDDGKSCAVIAEFLYLDDDTVRTWHKHYQSGGWDALEMFDWKGGMPYLSAPQEAALCLWLEERLCRDTKLFPAHAGMNRYCCLGVACELSVPRTRGDELGITPEGGTGGVCSPHTRG